MRFPVGAGWHRPPFRNIRAGQQFWAGLPFVYAARRADVGILNDQNALACSFFVLGAEW